MSRIKTYFVLFVIALGNPTAAAQKSRMNGFVIEDPLVPASTIMSGGPPRDGIPAIDSPRFVGAGEADFMSLGERVLGVQYDGIAKAFPIRILNRHEIVNDLFNGRAVMVTFCPLCGSGVVFDGEIEGSNRDFGVSGLLHNSDVLLYDRQTQSLWSQIMMRAINGPMKGAYLAQIAASNTTWEDWRERFPETLVMSTNTGYRFIDYDDDPYAEYKKNNRVWFPLTNTDTRLPSKAWVLGVKLGPAAKAFPLAVLYRQASPLHVSVGETQVRIEFDENHRTATVFDAQGKVLPSIQLYWFAWAAFHPDTKLHTAP
jgi:hypothetical protein